MLYTCGPCAGATHPRWREALSGALQGGLRQVLQGLLSSKVAGPLLLCTQVWGPRWQDGVGLGPARPILSLSHTHTPSLSHTHAPCLSHTPPVSLSHTRAPPETILLKSLPAHPLSPYLALSSTSQGQLVSSKPPSLAVLLPLQTFGKHLQIGRASCRERVSSPV